MALSAELIQELDTLTLSNDHVVGYSEQTMPELRAGEETGREAIRIYVDAKKPASELSADEVLPEELAGQPVDVVISGRLRRFATEATATERVGRVDPEKSTRPLIGGISGGLLKPSTTGTFGYFVKRGTDLCVLSSAHVLERQGGDAVQPGPLDGGGDAAKVGEVVVTIDDPNAGVDAAAAKLTGGVTATLTVNDIGSITGIAGVNKGDTVRKSATSTGFTTGTVADPNMTADVDGVLYRHQIKIEGTGGNHFAAPGDSGGLVVLGSKATGLIMGGDEDTGDTWANQIANVLSVLGATLPTS